MKIVISLFLNLFLISSAIGQVVIGEETLPDVTDTLVYQTFVDYEGNDSYREQGENLDWTFDEIELTGTNEEVISEPDSALLADFPEADFSFPLIAFSTAGVRTDTTMEIVGVLAADLFGFEFNSQTFPEPYVLRSVPMSYGDSLETSVNLAFVIDAALIPGLDSFELPFPGAGLDSLRINVHLYKKEKATAWGNLSFLGMDQEVLKVEQIDTTEFGADVGLSVFGQILWIDIGELLGGGMGGDNPLGALAGGAQGTLTHKFLVPDSKLSVLEFVERTMQDTLGMDTTLVSGRVGLEVLTSLAEPGEESGLTLYPNPTSDKIYLRSSEASLIDVKTAILLDFQGRILKDWQQPDLSAGLHMTGISPGTYLLMVETEEGLLSFPFVKTE